MIAHVAEMGENRGRVVLQLRLGASERHRAGGGGAHRRAPSSRRSRACSSRTQQLFDCAAYGFVREVSLSGRRSRAVSAADMTQDLRLAAQGARRQLDARVEELTRMPSDVQDALITILSEKTLPVPELGTELQAVRGFNVIATANDRDRGVNELSSALRRRFNTVVLPVPASAEQEVDIVARRVAQLGRSIGLPDAPPGAEEIRRVVTVFRELRQGVTEDGRAKVKSPSSTLSAAEAISVITSGLALAAHFGDGVLRAADVAGGITGAVVQDPVADRAVWQEYLETVIRERDDWSDFYRACRDVAG